MFRLTYFVTNKPAARPRVTVTANVAEYNRADEGVGQVPPRTWPPDMLLVMNVAPGDLVVGRAWSWTADRLRRDADIDRREKLAAKVDDSRFSVSVFAVRVQEGEEADDAAVRLAHHVRSHRNARWLAVVPESEIREGGFELVLNEPPPDHYDLVLGDVLSDDALVALEALFGKYERRRLPK